MKRYFKTIVGRNVFNCFHFFRKIPRNEFKCLEPTPASEKKLFIGFSSKRKNFVQDTTKMSTANHVYRQKLTSYIFLRIVLPFHKDKRICFHENRESWHLDSVDLYILQRVICDENFGLDSRKDAFFKRFELIMYIYIEISIYDERNWNTCRVWLVYMSDFGALVCPTAPEQANWIFNKLLERKASERISRGFPKQAFYYWWAINAPLTWHVRARSVQTYLLFGTL